MTSRSRAGADDGLPAGEPHALLSDDGVHLEATHWPAPPGAEAGTPVLVVCHGFGGSRHRDDTAAVLRWLRALAPVIALDFRGHGGSAGEATLGMREVLDLDAAVRWARTLGYAQVVAVGFSMGASVVVRHAALHGVQDTGPEPRTAHERVEAVVAVSGPAFWFYRGTAAMRTLHKLVETPVGRTLLRRAGGPRVDVGSWAPDGEMPLSPEQAARLLPPMPLLVVHGEADHYFPVEHAEALVAAYAEGARELRAAGGPVADAQLWIEPVMGHAEAGATEELLARVVTWCRRAVAAAPADGGAPGDGAEAPGEEGGGPSVLAGS